MGTLLLLGAGRGSPAPLVTPAPVPQTAALFADGVLFTVVYDRAVTSSGTGYTVKLNGVGKGASLTTVTGNLVNFVLDAPGGVVGDTLTVSYSGGDTVGDPDGVPVAAFADLPVSNYSAQHVVPYGLVLWAEADTQVFQERVSPATPSADGDPVGTVIATPDPTYLVAPDDGSRPTRSADGAIKVLEFNTGGHTADRFEWAAPTLSADYTVYVVFKRGASGHTNIPLGSGSGFALLGPYSDDNFYFSTDGNQFGVTPWSNTGLTAFRFRRDAGDHLYLLPSGLGAETELLLSPVSGPVTYDLIGGRASDSSYMTSGDYIAAIVLCLSDIHGTSDDDRVRAYLDAKYGVYL